MTTEMITVRPYAGDHEIPAICDLLNACSVADDDDDTYTATSLRSELDDPRVDATRDIRIWEDADGRMVAYGQPFVVPGEASLDGYVYLRIHPDLRGQGLETAVLSFNLARIRERVAAEGQPVEIFASVNARDTAMQEFYAAAGGTPVRWGYQMTRDLALPSAIPVLPTEFIVRGAQPEDAALWVAMYNESFIDHWHFHPLAAQTHAHWLSEDTYRPDLDLVAIAADGTFVAFAHCRIDAEANTRDGVHEGHIHLLGTRRGWRRLGIGRAMLRMAMQKMRDAGMQTVLLGVDAQNPSGAVSLYEDEGFIEKRRRITYQLP